MGLRRRPRSRSARSPGRAELGPASQSSRSTWSSAAAVDQASRSPYTAVNVRTLRGVKCSRSPRISLNAHLRLWVCRRPWGIFFTDGKMFDAMDSRTWIVRGGRVIDPAAGVDQIGDVLVEDGRVTAIGGGEAPAEATVVDATGCLVLPGLIDVHVHLRDPGQPWKETMATGTAAAAAGGFTTLFCMPNTEPALDTPPALRDLDVAIAREGRVRVHPIAAITRARAGAEAVDFGPLVDAGAVGFSDDGETTADSAIMRRALAASSRLDRPVMVHCEDAALAGGAMHEGAVSRRLGIAGIPAEAEEIVIARDLALARLTGGWLHVCHVSTGRGADLIGAAKREGVRVTAEVTPHHLLMDDEWVAGQRRLLNVEEPAGTDRAPADPNTKVNPPLRTAADTRRLLAALGDGTIDLVATDHAPHAAAEKRDVPFARAAFGLSGLEFALPLMLALVRAGHLSLSTMVSKMSWVPARLWGLPGGTLAVGAPADLTVVDPEARWSVAPERLATKSANTPLLGMTLRGRVRLTLVGGEERHHA